MLRDKGASADHPLDPQAHTPRLVAYDPLPVDGPMVGQTVALAPGGVVHVVDAGADRLRAAAGCA